METLHPLDQKVPKWPDFRIYGANGHWWAETNTGRPRTPIFRCTVGSIGNFSRHAAEQLGRMVLDERYAKAHPNGCPPSFNT